MNLSFPKFGKPISQYHPWIIVTKHQICAYIIWACYIYIYIYSFLVSAFAMECACASVFCLVCTLWFIWVSNNKRVTWLNYTNIHDTIIRCHKVYRSYCLMLLIFARKSVLLLFVDFLFVLVFSCSNQCTPWSDKNILSLVFQTRGP